MGGRARHESCRPGVPMSEPRTVAIRATLHAIEQGDPHAGRDLIPLVYQELRELARVRLLNDPAGQSLRPTDLGHEAYARIEAAGDGAWGNRAHFFAAAAEGTRGAVDERTRQRRQVKRGGGAQRVDLEDADGADERDPESLLALDTALEALEGRDPRLGEIVKLRCFVGLTLAQTAEALGLSTRTVDREWGAAKAWLRGRLGEGAGDGRRSLGPG